MEPSTETFKKCNKPLQKVCNGQGAMQCKTMYETVCSTKYVEKHKGVFVGDSRCEKMPIKMCGKGCAAIELKEQCRDEEVRGQKYATKLVFLFLEQYRECIILIFALIY